MSKRDNHKKIRRHQQAMGFRERLSYAEDRVIHRLAHPRFLEDSSYWDELKEEMKQ